MSHVSRVVDTESDGDDQIVARHRVDRQPPEVHEPAHVDQGEEDAEDGEQDVPVQLLGDHLIGLPRGVALAHGERLGGEVGVAQDFFHSVHCGNLLLWPVHQMVGEGNCGQLGIGWNKNLISRD